MFKLTRFTFAKISCTWYPNSIMHNFSNISTSTSQLISNFKELEIPMPYGKLSAKAWGSGRGKPVLALHGLLDNCGTFDTLMPLLDNQLYVIAIDAPGIGLSSHKPPGHAYTEIDTILDYRKVVDYFKWDKFYMMGHSHGGTMCLEFCALFPDIVEKVVIFDMQKMLSVPKILYNEVVRKRVPENLSIEKKMLKPPRVYSDEEAVAKLLKALYNVVNPEGAKILLRRGSQPSECGKGVVFTRDLRCFLIEYNSLKTHELVYEYSSAVNCELMHIVAKTRLNFFDYHHIINQTPEVEKVFEIHRKNAKKFIIEYVDGNHYVHLNEPEKVAPLINNFLIK